MSVTTGDWVDGKLVNIRVLSDEMLKSCPLCSFDPDHYKNDGTCLCFDVAYQNEVKRKRLERRAKH